VDGPIVWDSARRHGIPDDDILHAYRNPLWVEPVDDEGLTMLVGPDRAANLLEVGVVDSDSGPVVVHAMAARDKYLR